MVGRDVRIGVEMDQDELKRSGADGLVGLRVARETLLLPVGM